MKNVFITGASSGIGLQLAIQFSARGERLGLLALPGDDLTKAADMSRDAGAAEVLAFGADVRDRAVVRKAIQEFAKTGSGIDLFIGCAGVDYEVPFDDFNAGRSEFLYDVNLKGLMFGANAALELMLAQGRGHVVGISSLSGWRILPVHADYCATKCAVNAYLESLRVRLRGRDITVTTVSPGFVRTPMVAGNLNPMPFAVDADVAARRILRAIDARKNHVAFSLPLVFGTRLLRALPDPLWRFLLRFI